MEALPGLTGFFRSDEDHEPFGVPWLRGLTPGRMGLVLAVCGLLTVRQSLGELFSAPWREQLIEVLTFFARQLLCFLPTLLLVTAADNLSADLTSRRRIAALTVALVAGALAYPLLYIPLLNLDDPSREFLQFSRAVQLKIAFFEMLRPLIYGGALTAVLYLVTREQRTNATLQDARLKRAAIDRQLTEAQLQALQAQIEPHFLFNTLANIKSLYRTEHADGKQLLHDLSDYLCAALPQMRETASTLRRELALSSAYLRVLQVRMGDRLKVVIRVGEDLGNARLPPMMLLTLIENAIKHGLNPLPEGGTVCIDATRNGETLRVQVIDTGVGFQKKRGTGVGLANTRARLTTLYGAAASLAIRPNPGGGVIAEIDLPFERSRDDPPQS